MTLGFRPLERGDFGVLGEWLGAPHVARWWPEGDDADAIEATYGPVVDGGDPTEVVVVELEGRPVGLIQRYLLGDNPQWREALSAAGPPEESAGIDYLIGAESLVGRGVGPQMIAEFADDTWGRYPDVPAIVVAVAQPNRASWRVLEKAGFRRVFDGAIDSPDPADAGPHFVYVLRRPRRSRRASPATTAAPRLAPRRRPEGRTGA